MISSFSAAGRSDSSITISTAWVASELLHDRQVSRIVSTTASASSEMMPTAIRQPLRQPHPLPPTVRCCGVENGS